MTHSVQRVRKTLKAASALTKSKNPAGVTLGAGARDPRTPTARRTFREATSRESDQSCWEVAQHYEF